MTEAEKNRMNQSGYNAVQSSFNNYMQNGVSANPTLDAASRGVQPQPLPSTKAQPTDTDAAIDAASLANEQKMANATRDYRDDIAKLSGGPSKQEQQQRFVAGIGDAISGFAGLISAARGGQAVNTNGRTAMDSVMNEQEKRRLERRKQIENFYNLSQSEYRMERERLADRRKRLKDERDYALKSRNADADSEYKTYRNQKAKADADKAATAAGLEESRIKSQIAKNNRTGLPKAAATPKPEKETPFRTNSRSFSIPASKQSQAISAAIAAINADEGFEPRSKKAQDIFNEYLQSGRADGNEAFWRAISPYINDNTTPQKKGGLPGRAKTSTSTAGNTNNDDPYGLMGL